MLFIHANILAHEIGHEHKKNIHKIIIGAKGIKLAEDLADLKATEKNKNQVVSSLVSQFNRSSFTIPMAEFLVIAPAEEATVGQRIHKLEQDIKSKESEAVVQGLGFPIQMTAPSFALSTAKTLAAKNIATAHESAEKQVLDHIDHNFKDKIQARQFIRQGLDLIQADCPFCGQDLKNAADLLMAYREFFDEAFRTYQQNVAQQATFLSKWNLDNDLTALVSSHNANLAVLRQWEPHLGPNSLPDVAATIEKFRAKLAELKDKVQSELEKKQKDPNANADLSHFDALAAELTGLKAVVEAYNNAVSDFTEKAKQYVANLPKLDVASLRTALAKEQQIKNRFSKEWKIWATNYPTAKNDANEILRQKNAKQKELNEYTKTIFGTYQERINEILLALGADFKVTDLVGRVDNKANEVYSDFGFLILIREKKVLQIKSDKANGSRIESFDVEEDRKAEIARLFDDMGRYLDEDYGPTPKDIQGEIRKVFEIILKHKYYRSLTEEIRGKKGLGDLIRTLHEKKRISDEMKDKLFRLCRLSDVAHHGALVCLPEHSLTREEICAAIHETFIVAEEV